MKNTSFIVTVMFIIGIIMGLYLKISIAFLLCLGICFMLCIILTKLKKEKKKLIIYIIIVLISIVYTNIRNNDFYRGDSNIDNVNMTVKIVNLESVNDYYVTYKAKVVSVNSETIEDNNANEATSIKEATNINRANVKNKASENNGIKEATNINGIDVKNKTNENNVINANNNKNNKKEDKKNNKSDFKYKFGFILVKIRKEYLKSYNQKETNDKYRNKYKNENNDENQNKSKEKNVNKDEKQDENVINLGDIIKISGYVDTIEEQRNFKGFDYKKYLFSNNVYAVIKCNNIENVKNNKNIIYIVKNNIIKIIKSNLSNKNSSICLATLIGYKAEMQEDVKEIFKECNLSHLLAISGMHVSIIISLVDIISNKLSKNQVKIFNIAVLILYLALVGFVPSVIRACLMQIFMSLGYLFHRKSSGLSNLSISALILLIINPLIILNVGFVFSFIGTLSIILFYNAIGKIIDYIKLKFFIFNERVSKNHIKCSSKCTNMININMKEAKIPKKDAKIPNTNIRNAKVREINSKIIIKLKNSILNYVTEVIKVCISANILLIPISVYYSNSFSILFLFSNIISGLILSCILFLSLAKITLSIFHLNYFCHIDNIINFVIENFIKITELIANIPYSKITITTPNIVVMIIIYTAIFFILYLYKSHNLNKKFFYNIWMKVHCFFNIKIIALIMIVIFIFNLFCGKYIKIDLSIYFIDVGQGDGTLIVTKSNKKILIDGGGNGTSNYDIGKKVLVPYLLDRRIKCLDYIIISHFDSDHSRLNSNNFRRN